MGVQTLSLHCINYDAITDDGISGTNTKKREEFNRMIEDCMDGKIDMVITKSISRFARNTLDCLKYIRQLKEKNIPVYFEKESINTLDSKGEVLLTIMASLAQQESQSLSQNVKLGLQYRYQQGQVQVNCKWFLGYTKDADGHLVIDPEQAETVKRIYREYLDGKSALQISRGLEADGIKNGAGKTRWHPSTIYKILSNEKYIGDALLQKTYTVDFLNKKRVKNTDIVPQYYVEKNHEPIIPREIFMRVQEERARRKVVHTSNNGTKRVFSCGKLANTVVCGKCGEFYRRIHWYNSGKKSIVWRCISRLENTGLYCDARTVSETDLEKAIITAINKTLCDRDTFLEQLKQNIEKVIKEGKNQPIAEIDKRLIYLQEELLKRTNARADFEDIAQEIHALREQKQKLLMENANQTDAKQRIADMEAFLNEHPSAITEYDDSLVRRLIEKVTIYNDKFVVEFKSGVTVDVDE